MAECAPENFYNPMGWEKLLKKTPSLDQLNAGANRKRSKGESSRWDRHAREGLKSTKRTIHPELQDQSKNITGCSKRVDRNNSKHRVQIFNV